MIFYVCVLTKDLAANDATKGFTHVKIYLNLAVVMVFVLWTKNLEKHPWVTDANVTFGG